MFFSVSCSALFSSPRFAPPGIALPHISRNGHDSPSFVGKFFFANIEGNEPIGTGYDALRSLRCHHFCISLGRTSPLML